MRVNVGSGPNSWGIWFPDDPNQTPPGQFLDEVAEAGYEWIELGPRGYLPQGPTELRAELEGRGLKASGNYVLGVLESAAAWSELEGQLAWTGETLSALGASYVVLIDDLYSDLFTGHHKTSPILGSDAWKTLIETTHKSADFVAARFGLRLVFHPHAATHVEYETQIEAFLNDTDPGRVALCLDTGHHVWSGGDPVKFLRKHHDRIAYLHLKAVDSKVRDRVVRDDLPFATAVQMGIFCEPAQGAMNYAALRDALIEVDFDGFGIVEHDMYPAPPGRPLPIARRTRRYLKEIGVG
jgi:inosose dehydratase